MSLLPACPPIRCCLLQVNLKCFSALVKQYMPERLSGSISFYKSCAY